MLNGLANPHADPVDKRIFEFLEHQFEHQRDNHAGRQRPQAFDRQVGDDAVVNRAHVERNGQCTEVEQRRRQQHPAQHLALAEIGREQPEPGIAPNQVTFLAVRGAVDRIKRTGVQDFAGQQRTKQAKRHQLATDSITEGNLAIVADRFDQHRTARRQGREQRQIDRFGGHVAKPAPLRLQPDPRQRKRHKPRSHVALVNR